MQSFDVFFDVSQTVEQTIAGDLRRHDTHVSSLQ